MSLSSHTRANRRGEGERVLNTLTHIAAALVGEEGREEEVGEEKSGRRTAKPAPRSRTFTFATLPQFSEEATPSRARTEGSHFTVYITLIDQ